MGADFCIWKGLLQDPWCKQVWRKARVKPVVRCRRPPLVCASLDLMLPAVSVQVKDFSLAAARSMSLGLARVVLLLKAYPVAVQIVPAVGLIVFSVWGLGPVTRQLRKFFLKKSEKTWDNSLTQLLMASYMRPILVWMGVMIICRAIDPLVLSTEASHAIKDRFVNFVRSLSTVLAFAFCTASLTQQIQRFMMERQDSQEARNVGVQFIGNTVYTSVWVAAVCLFMELLGFSTQKWITAGGFGTVLLTLAGREIFTNFLSSVMIHATRPFVESEWIQTKIEGQEVSGTVEHVGWWSPTVIRGDDREAVHIPNHKFTVSVVRNLSQKNHWRIKIHFGISHLDVNKIKHIVADMRKVLAKHPSVEQHRLHRRVFFDNIDPENQALLILVSCFVKTPHFEEYLRVKEIILLDLLKVISHHHARLATPIRSVQRVMDDNESRQSPFRDVAARTENHRPFLLVEAAPVSDQEKELVKVKTDSGEGNMSAKGPLKPTAYAAEDGAGTNPKLEAKERVLSGTELKGAGEAPSQSPAPKPQLEGLDSMGLNAGDITLLGAAFEKPPANFPEGLLDGGPYAESPQVEKVTVRTPGEKTRPKNPSEKGVLRAGEVANEQIADALAADETRKMAGDKPSPVEQGPSKDERALQNAGSETAEISDPWLASSGSSSMSEKPDHVQTNVRAGGGLADERASSVQMPQSLEENVLLGVAINGPKRTLPLDDERPTPAEQRMPSATASSSPRPQSVEDMLLLGVALDGPKRTLPLGDDKSSSTEQRELVIPRNGNGGTA